MLSIDESGLFAVCVSILPLVYRKGNMIRRILFIVLLLIGGAGAVYAQSGDATPAVPSRPTATPIPDDPRLSVCSAPTLEGFVPYIVRPGDSLADLLVGIPNISVTQLAALNCIDDPSALPVGAVIWIPEHEAADATEEPESDEPEIIRFEADAESVQNQAGVTLSWQAVGETAYLYTCPTDEDIDCERPFNAQELPLNFETEAISGFLNAGNVRYRLEVTGGEETVTEDIVVEITCSQEWLGQTTGVQACPQEPAIAVFAAWQPFEGGVMMWFSDTEQIWVMTNEDNRIQVFDDLFEEGQPDPEAEAPEGLFTPVRGFGLVWEQLGGEDSELGWAMSEEIGFDSARQSASPRSYTVYIKGPDTVIYAVTLIPQIDVGYWAQISE
jgi:hypothetical protein